jgi:hypothetical protein
VQLDTRNLMTVELFLRRNIHEHRL